MAQQLVKQCHQYINTHLRSPSKQQMRRWGKRLGVKTKDIDLVAQSLLLRHQLGKINTLLPVSL